MAICSNCGEQTGEGSRAKFCQYCGCAIGNSNKATVSFGQRQQEYTGTVYKCSNCGEVLQSFVTTCPACGYELRGTKATNAISEMAAKLEAIRSGRDYRKPDFVEQFHNFFEPISAKDKQKIDLIRSFAIPNTKEDIFEFIIMAASNVDETAYEYLKRNSSDRQLSDAWLVKLEQAYHKAKFSFGSSSDFYSIHNIYERTNKKVNNATKKAKMSFTLGCGMIIAIFVLLIFAAAVSSGR